MAIVFSRGDLTFVTPFNGDGDTYFFGMTCNYGLPEQGTDQWKYIGQNGLGMKLMGLGGTSGQVAGFIDAASDALLQTGIANLRAAVGDKTPTDAVLSNGITVHYTIVVSCPIIRLWGHGDRHCADFILTWVAPE